jgi:hypothetical protein
LVRIPCGSKDDQVYKKNMNSWYRNWIFWNTQMKIEGPLFILKKYIYICLDHLCSFFFLCLKVNKLKLMVYLQPILCKVCIKFQN